MKTLLLALVLATAAHPAALAEEKAKLTPAEKFLNATRFEESGIEAAQAAFRPFLQQMEAQGLPPAALKEIEAAAAGYFHQLMTDPELKQEVLKLYNATFSEDELAEMLAFYETPVGRKALRQMPRIMGDAMVLGEKYGKKYSPAFEAQIGKILEKYEDAGDDDQPAPEEKK